MGITRRRRPVGRPGHVLRQLDLGRARVHGQRGNRQKHGARQNRSSHVFVPPDVPGPARINWRVMPEKNDGRHENRFCPTVFDSGDPAAFPMVRQRH